MSGPEFGTFAAQLCLQQFVFILEDLVCQQEFVVQLIPLGDARLKRASVSVVGEDSRVMFTQPSFNYSTRISGIGDSDISILLRRNLTE